MRTFAALIAIAVVGIPTTALASRHPVPAQASTVFEPAAMPAYPLEAAPTRVRHARHHHRALHHEEAHARPRRHATEAVASTRPSAPPPTRETALTPPTADIGPEPAQGPVSAVLEELGAIPDAAYLVRTACPGATMTRQGTWVAIARLNPVFIRRLAASFRDARKIGVTPCVASAYRPPSFGVGGFRDKFESAHSYGLAVDVGDIGRPGSSDAVAFAKVAARHGVYDPYGPYNAAEWNHFQPTKAKLVCSEAPLRKTITAQAPRLLSTWKVSAAILAPEGLSAVLTERRRARHYARHHLRHYARA